MPLPAGLPRATSDAINVPHVTEKLLKGKPIRSIDHEAPLSRGGARCIASSQLTKLVGMDHRARLAIIVTISAPKKGFIPKTDLS